MAVRRVKGVQKVEGDARNKTLSIQFDPEVAYVETIKEAMGHLGYEAMEAL